MVALVNLIAGELHASFSALAHPCVKCNYYDI